MQQKLNLQGGGGGGGGHNASPILNRVKAMVPDFGD